DLTVCRTLEAMHRSEKFVHRTSMIEGVRVNPTLVATPSQESVSHDDAWNRVSCRAMNLRSPVPASLPGFTTCSPFPDRLAGKRVGANPVQLLLLRTCF